MTKKVCSEEWTIKMLQAWLVIITCFMLSIGIYFYKQYSEVKSVLANHKAVILQVIEATTPKELKK